MKKMMLLMFLLGLGGLAISQPKISKRFIESFKAHDRSKILTIRNMILVKNKMTMEEALKYVYSNDTSKLYCIQKEINQETEEQQISRDLYLPNKSLFIAMENYYLVGFSFYDCRDPEMPLKFGVCLKTVNKEFVIVDSLVAFFGSDYEPDISGILNPVNSKIFLIGKINSPHSIEAAIYHINSETFKFDRVKHIKGYNGNPENLKEAIIKIGWETDFYD